jgi:hypothetical protein
MAISDTQKVDLLYKKIAWAATKTDTNPPKEAYNEANPSPLLIRGDTLWQLSASIPASIPSATTSVVQVYKDGGGGGYTATVECTELAVTDNRTWSTGLTNWIDPQFGSTYFAKVYVDTAGSTTPQTTGTALQAAGLNDDQWYFDYQSGILNFIGSNLPASIATGITGKSVFVSGARYVGPTGVVTWSNGLTIGNITISGNTISSTVGNVNISGIGNLSVTGNITTTTFIGNVSTNYITANTGNVVTITGTGALAVPVGTTAQRPSGQNGLIRFNTELPSIEYHDGNAWIPITNTVTDQQIVPDGVSTIYSLDQEATTIGVIVSINGIIQRPTVAYTVNTNQITFTETPEATDIIDIRFLGAAVNINSTLSDDLVVSGNLTVNGNIVNGLNNFYTYGNAQVAAYLVANPQGGIYSNANVQSYIGANIGSFYTYSNATYSTVANAGTQQASINSINANIGSFYTYANTILYSNTNVAAYLTTGNISTSNLSVTGNLTVSGNSTLTGNVTAPTANISVNNTQLATTAFVRSMLPTGIIVMWSGSSASIPYGWYLCDGNNSTPNLVNRFIVGATSTYAVGATGGTADAVVVSHNHGGSTAADATHTHTFSGTSSGQSASHTHSVGYYMDDDNGNNGYLGIVDGDNTISSNYQTGSTSNDHTHTYSGTTSAGSSHSHTITTDGVSGTNQNLPPYYALCYIMKS